jgi:hypothetical protein
MFMAGLTTGFEWKDLGIVLLGPIACELTNSDFALNSEIMWYSQG